MTKPKKPTELRDPDKLIRYAKKQGARVEQGGRHTKLYVNGALIPVPRHRGNLATGTFWSIIKGLMAAGIPFAVLVAAATFLLSQGALP
jgi:hypothetical protein